MEWSVLREPGALCRKALDDALAVVANAVRDGADLGMIEVLASCAEVWEPLLAEAIAGHIAVRVREGSGCRLRPRQSHLNGQQFSICNIEALDLESWVVLRNVDYLVQYVSVLSTEENRHLVQAVGLAPTDDVLRVGACEFLEASVEDFARQLVECVALYPSWLAVGSLMAR